MWAVSGRCDRASKKIRGQRSTKDVKGAWTGHSPDHVDELPHRQVLLVSPGPWFTPPRSRPLSARGVVGERHAETTHRRYEVLLLVDCGDVTLLRLLADDLASARTAMARWCQLTGILSGYFCRMRSASAFRLSVLVSSACQPSCYVRRRSTPTRSSWDGRLGGTYRTGARP